MPLIPDPDRLEVLRGWGVSEATLRLSGGELLHRVFHDVALGPPWHIYRGTIWIPEQGELAPLWECSSSVEAVLRDDSGTHFIRLPFEAETAEQLETLSKSEAGFWTHKFDFLYECDEDEEDLRAAAASVGYSRIDDYLEARVLAEPGLGSTADHDLWLASQVRIADGEAG